MTNHTDTSRSGDLVERLREVSSVLFDDYGDGTYAVEDYALATKAADRIEALEAENERLREALRTALWKLTTDNALAAQHSQETAMTDEAKALVERLRTKYCCSDWDKGCNCEASADLIETQASEIERLRELLDAWLGLAREHLDTELAGRTFEALERTRK